MEFIRVPEAKRAGLLPLLRLADDDEKALSEYIHEGELYVIHSEGRTAGAVLMIVRNETTVELKNIAFLPEERGRGLGRRAVQLLKQVYSERGFTEMIVGTANSSIGNIVFYQKCGFRIFDIVSDYFSHLHIIENGIPIHDMIMFRCPLRQKEQ